MQISPIIASAFEAATSQAMQRSSWDLVIADTVDVTAGIVAASGARLLLRNIDKEQSVEVMLGGVGIGAGVGLKTKVGVAASLDAMQLPMIGRVFYAGHHDLEADELCGPFMLATAGAAMSHNTVSGFAVMLGLAPGFDVIGQQFGRIYDDEFPWYEDVLRGTAFGAAGVYRALQSMASGGGCAALGRAMILSGSLGLSVTDLWIALGASVTMQWGWATCRAKASADM